jgi:hypothetical protein
MHERKFLSLFVLTIFLNSCATIINHPFQKIHISHDPELSIRIDTSKYFYRSSEIYNVFIPKNYVKKDFYFLRSKNEIPVIINETDTFKLKPHRSYFAFWFANIYTSYGLGMLIDWSNDKSFEYPVYNYFTKVDSQIKNVRFKPIPEKKVKFTFGVSSINFFHLQTDSGKIKTVSGLGISSGIEYFMRKDIYVSLNIGVTMNLYSARNDTINKLHDIHEFHFGSYEASSAKYLSLRINKLSPRFEYGIGLTLTNLKWNSNNRTNLTDSTYAYSPASYKSLNLGLTSVLRLRLMPGFNIGVQYQPLFFEFQRKKCNYQHFITTELIWRF